MPKLPARHIIGALTSMPWAMTEDYLRLMVQIASRDNLDVEAVERQMGRKLDNTHMVSERGGVAIIPVVGPIFRYANLFSAVSGATSIQTLATDFSSALNNPDVKAILLNIDSPGGEANGVAEFAEMVYTARGTKPIWAYVGGVGASAAYWIASTADQIIAHETALLGSIGVVVAVPNGQGDAEMEFVSSQSPRKRPDPTTEEGRVDIQYIIDSLAQTFVETVARNRNVSVDTVLVDFGQGALLVGRDTVAAKLADRMGTFEQTLAELSAKGAQAGRAQVPAAFASADTSSGYLPSLPEIHQPAGLALAASALPIDPYLMTSSAPTGGAARGTTPNQPKEHTTMTEPLEQAPPASSGPPPATLPNALDTYTAQMEARIRAAEEAAFARARSEFERRINERDQRHAIESFAHARTMTALDQPWAIPCTADELTALLAETPSAPRVRWMTLLTRITSSGLVSFDEIGSSGEGAEGQDLWNQLVNAKMAAGMNRVQAIQTAAKEQPALYEAQSLPKKRGGR